MKICEQDYDQILPQEIVSFFSGREKKHTSALVESDGHLYQAKDSMKDLVIQTSDTHVTRYCIYTFCRGKPVQ